MKIIKKFALFFVLLLLESMSYSGMQQQPQSPQDMAQHIISMVLAQGQPSAEILQNQIADLLAVQASLPQTDPRSIAIKMALPKLQSYLTQTPQPTPIQNVQPAPVQKNQFVADPSLSTHIYAKNIDPSDPQAADRLTEESYISPEMQWAVVSLSGQQNIIINKITGAPQAMPIVDTMLAAINSQLRQSIPSSAQKETMKNALHAMLEATDIALFVATVEAAHQNQKFVLYQNVNDQLNIKLKNQKQAIQGALNLVNAQIPIDQPIASTSYFSWILGSSTQNSSQKITPTPQPVSFLTTSALINIPADLMQAIIKNNDYKQEPTAIEAANLLFKQCFIAQQHHLKDSFRINQIKIDLQSPINASNYIFKNFPKIYNKIDTTYPICQIAINIVPAHQFRIDIQSPRTDEQIQAHALLLHIRQAIQTALYVANKKSNFNVGYLLSSYITSYLDGIVSELMKYDAQLSILCKEPKYGATPDDVYQDEQWATISKIAAGVVVTAVVGGAAYAYAPTAAGYVAQKASAWMPTWLGGSSAAPFIGPQPNSPTDFKEYFKNEPSTLQTIGQYAGTAAQYAGTTKMATSVLLMADNSGIIGAPGELNASSGGALSAVDKVAGKTVTYGGAINTATNMGNIVKAVYDNPTNLYNIANLAGATGAISGALSQALNDSKDFVAQLTNNPELLSKVENDLRLCSMSLNQGVNKYYAAKDVMDITQGNYTNILSASQRLYNAYFALNPVYLNIQNYMTPGANTDKLPEAKLYAGFIKIIESPLAKDIDLTNIITNLSINLLQNKKTDKVTIVQALENIKTNYTQNPILVIPLTQALQNIQSAVI